jgi:hypothetical protein
VVSSPEALTVVIDKEQESHHHKSKRRKHPSNETASSSTTSHHLTSRRNFPHREVTLSRKRQLITHYAIQLEHIEVGYRKLGSTNSGSECSISPTVEAQLLGLTKSELRRQRDLDANTGTLARRLVNPPEPDIDSLVDDAMDSESSNPHECVTAVG